MRYVFFCCCLFINCESVWGQLSPDTEAMSQVLDYKEPPNQVLNSTEATLPITMKGGLILVEATIDGGKEHFVLDTGAPNLFINSSNVKADSSQVEAISVTGNIAIEYVVTPQLRMDALVQKNIPSFKIDIHHLEELKECKMGGILGHDLLKDHEVFVDYQNKTLKLLDPNNKVLEEQMRMKKRIPFRMEGHFVIIQVKVGKHTLSLGIDTGSEVNVIDKKWKRKLKKHYKRLGNQPFRGFDDQSRSSVMCQLKTLKMEDQTYKKQKFLFLDLSNINAAYDSQLDGLLGYSFLKNLPFSINYQDQYLYIWDYLPTAIKPSELLLTKDQD